MVGFNPLQLLLSLKSKWPHLWPVELLRLAPVTFNMILVLFGNLFAVEYDKIFQTYLVHFQPQRWNLNISRSPDFFLVEMVFQDHNLWPRDAHCYRFGHCSQTFSVDRLENTCNVQILRLSLFLTYNIILILGVQYSD